jgi:protein-L-isoaspartate(D-aspartate) O-methyltransferase
MTDFEKMRSNMVKGQLLPNEVMNSRLLRAFLEIPREIFVTQQDQGLAYSDTNLKIAPDRYLLKPLILGKLLQAAELEPTFKVLDIGAATGYVSALLSYSVRSVIAVEEELTLFDILTKNVDRFNTYSIVPMRRALNLGAEEEAPFDIIIIEGAVEQIPQELFNQLKKGGKLLTLEVKDTQGLTQAVRYQKMEHEVAKRPLFECEAYPLKAFAQHNRGFQFS